MKTIVEISGNNYGSVGNIALNIAKCARNQGFNVYTFSKKSKKAMSFHYPNHLFIGTWIDRIISEQFAYYTGLKDHFNIINTYLFINKLKKIKPDLIHIHMLHDSFVNLSMLFNYINKNNIPVVWTFHDANAFTGQCTYFDIAGCNKWKSSCHNCPQINKYPNTFVDKTNILFNEKKKLFSNTQNMTIISCSNWMNSLVKQSILKEKNSFVINNGIDLNVFKPIESSYKKDNKLENKYILLGVAYNWGQRKGLNTFIELANRFDDNYQIILVGTNDENDKILPKNIISIHRTYNQKQLVELYSCADLFVNPTIEDNFPTVNIEALACGTPVITYDTGGSKEMLDGKCGSVIKKKDIDALEKEIIRICETKPYQKKDCLAKAKQYDMYHKFDEYISLYKKLLNC